MESLKHREERAARVGWLQAIVTPEMRIATEVAVQLRISPKYTDDGAPEGTCEKPLPPDPPQPRRSPSRVEESASDLFHMNP
jgi:hypothetical protein